MDSIILQSIFILGSLFFLALIVFFMRKKHLSLRYSLVWIFTAFAILFVSVFPNTIVFIAGLLGFEEASNAVFSLIIFFLIVILLQVTAIISSHSSKIVKLVQTVALLEKRIRDLEARDK